MSDESANDVEFDSEGNAVLNPRIREQLRNQERENAALKKQLRDTELKAIYAELRIPNEKAGKLFRDTYSGDVTLEAVRSAAAEYDVLPGAPDPVVDSRRNAELDALRRVNGATDANETKDAQEVLQEVLAKLKAAKSVEEFDAIMASGEVQSLAHSPISFA